MALISPVTLATEAADCMAIPSWGKMLWGTYAETSCNATELNCAVPVLCQVPLASQCLVFLKANSFLHGCRINFGPIYR